MATPQTYEWYLSGGPGSGEDEDLPACAVFGSQLCKLEGALVVPPEGLTIQLAETAQPVQVVAAGRVGVVAGGLEDVVQDRDHLDALPVGTGRVGYRHQLVQVVVTASFVDLALVRLHGEEVGGGNAEQHGWAPPDDMETPPLLEGRRCGSTGSSTRSLQGTTSGRTDCRPGRSAARLPTLGSVGRPPPAVPLRPTRPRSAGESRRRMLSTAHGDPGRDGALAAGMSSTRSPW